MARACGSASAARRVFFDGELEGFKSRPDRGQTDLYPTVSSHEGLEFFESRVRRLRHEVR